jgi:hypothetical protein
MRMREWDCGYYDAQSEFGRVTVRERVDGLYDLIHVRYERTARGLLKSELAVGVSGSRAKRQAGALFPEKSDAQPLKVGLTYFPMSTHEPSMLWEA